MSRTNFHVPAKPTGPGGETVLRMEGWTMSVPNSKDGNAEILIEASQPVLCPTRQDGPGRK